MRREASWEWLVAAKRGWQPKGGGRGESGAEGEMGDGVDEDEDGRSETVSRERAKDVVVGVEAWQTFFWWWSGATDGRS
jgi:hypothetical protein